VSDDNIQVQHIYQKDAYMNIFYSRLGVPDETFGITETATCQEGTAWTKGQFIHTAITRM